MSPTTDVVTIRDLIHEPAWMTRALCRDARYVDVEFFIERGQDSRPAKALCARCPVRSDCLDYALTEEVKHGVWGGLSERERKRLRRSPLAERADAA